MSKSSLPMKAALSALSVCFFALPANAKLIECKLNNWTGGSESVAVSWTGYRFIIDTKKLLAKSVEGGREKWHPVKARKTKKFTTYKSFQNAASMEYNSDDLKVDVSYRIYERGKCTITSSIAGYQPIKGTGEVK
jgi:hypothetical protein